LAFTSAFHLDPLIRVSLPPSSIYSMVFLCLSCFLKWRPPNSPLTEKQSQFCFSGVHFPSSCNCFELGRVVEISLPMCLMFWQRIIKQSMGTWQGPIEYWNKIVR
jgi:hypothetical protein